MMGRNVVRYKYSTVRLFRTIQLNYGYVEKPQESPPLCSDCRDESVRLSVGRQKLSSGSQKKYISNLALTVAFSIHNETLRVLNLLKISPFNLRVLLLLFLNSHVTH